MISHFFHANLSSKYPFPSPFLSLVTGFLTIFSGCMKFPDIGLDMRPGDQVGDSFSLVTALVTWPPIWATLSMLNQGQSWEISQDLTLPFLLSCTWHDMTLYLLATSPHWHRKLSVAAFLLILHQIYFPVANPTVPQVVRYFEGLMTHQNISLQARQCSGR